MVICPVVVVSAIFLGGEGNGNDGEEAVVETWIENVGCMEETLSETWNQKCNSYKVHYICKLTLNSVLKTTETDLKDLDTLFGAEMIIFCYGFH